MENDVNKKVVRALLGRKPIDIDKVMGNPKARKRLIKCPSDVIAVSVLSKNPMEFIKTETKRIISERTSINKKMKIKKPRMRW